MLKLLFLPIYVEFKSRECENCLPGLMVFPMFCDSFTSLPEKSRAKKYDLTGLSQDGAQLLQESGPRMWKPGCPHPSWKPHPRTLDGCPVDFLSSVPHHHLPISMEDLERYRDLWALKRPVCKTGYFWSQCYPSKRTKYTGKPQGRASRP